MPQPTDLVIPAEAGIHVPVYAKRYLLYAILFVTLVLLCHLCQNPKLSAFSR
jgi:hypothetical protein